MAAALTQVDVVSEDAQAVLAFYRRAGIEIPDEKVWRHGGRVHHVSVAFASGVELSLSSAALTTAYAPSWSNPAGPIVILNAASGLDVDERFAALVSGGAPVVAPPFDAFWGSRYAIVRDPAGSAVGIMGPAEREHTAPPGFEGP